MTACRKCLCGFVGAVVALALCAAHAPRAWSAGDEIQVYIDDLQPRGKRGVELHANYVPRGRLTSDYPGEQPPGHVLRVTPEFSWGLGHNWDWGLYVPFSADKDTGTTYSDYAKLRLKYLIDEKRPDASEFYGFNVEVARSPRRTSPSAWASELRGILGMRRGGWLLAMNAILTTPLDRSVAENTVDLDLNFKVAKDMGGGLALGFEHYAETGPVRRPRLREPAGETTFAVLDYEGKGWGVNLGIGHGWTETADRRVVKMILGWPL